jgi:hypothetical protein
MYIYIQTAGRGKTDKETDGKMGVEPAPAPRLLKSSSGCCSKISRSRRNGWLYPTLHFVISILGRVPPVGNEDNPTTPAG